MSARKRVELLDQAGRPFVQAHGDGRAQLGPLRELHADAEAVRALEVRIRSRVQALRAGGVSWAAIGHQLGTTKQAAAARYGRDVL